VAGGGSLSHGVTTVTLSSTSPTTVCYVHTRAQALPVLLRETRASNSGSQNPLSHSHETANLTATRQQSAGSGPQSQGLPERLSRACDPDNYHTSSSSTASPHEQLLWQMSHSRMRA
jgi:hypothetical protein